MANFIPLNDYTMYILDKMIVKYHLKPPFLDGGCGTGYVSKFLATRGWQGKAIDLSDEAIRITKKNLSSFKKIQVLKQEILNQKGKFNTIILFDVLEHIKDDNKVLRKINQLLNPGGYVILALTSNPKEWRWDDEFYGHYRRYTEDDIKYKLIKTGYKPRDFIEYTFPVFWLIRVIYTSIIKPPKANFYDKAERTNTSGIFSAWNIPPLLNIILKLDFFWKTVFFIQYLFFRNVTSFGFAMLVVANKPRE